jgi:hypothetical protein
MRDTTGTRQLFRAIYKVETVSHTKSYRREYVPSQTLGDMPSGEGGDDSSAIGNDSSFSNSPDMRETTISSKF